MSTSGSQTLAAGVAACGPLPAPVLAAAPRLPCSDLSHSTASPCPAVREAHKSRNSQAHNAVVCRAGDRDVPQAWRITTLQRIIGLHAW